MEVGNVGFVRQVEYCCRGIQYDFLELWDLRLQGVVRGMCVRASIRGGEITECLLLLDAGLCMCVLFFLP